MGRTLKVFKQNTGFKVFQQVKDETEFVPWLQRKPFQMSITFNEGGTYIYEINAKGIDTVGRGHIVTSETIAFSSGSTQTFNNFIPQDLPFGEAEATSQPGIFNDVDHYVYMSKLTQNFNSGDSSSFDDIYNASAVPVLFTYVKGFSQNFNDGTSGSFDLINNLSITHELIDFI